MIVGNDPAKYVFSGIIYYLVTLFLLTLLMILKRVHVLLGMEVSSN